MCIGFISVHNLSKLSKVQRSTFADKFLENGVHQSYIPRPRQQPHLRSANSYPRSNYL